MGYLCMRCQAVFGTIECLRNREISSAVEFGGSLWYAGSFAGFCGFPEPGLSGVI